MLWLKRMALLLMGLLVLLLTGAFFLENQTMVFLSFIGWKTPELPLSFFVLLAFACGGAIGALLGQLLALGVKARLVATRKELARCRNTLESARLQSSE
ncbi:MAG: lipopolysaccharide assembly protein LapA domain-containing protein [Pseudomonadota bacterium]